MELNRRDALKLGVLSGAAVVLPVERAVRARMALANRLPASLLPAPFTVPYAAPPVIDLTNPAVPMVGGSPYQRIEMTQFNTEIIPGLQTPVWGYNGSVPGPTIYARRGVPVVVRQVNNLPDTHPQLGYRPWTSVHLHGSPTLPQYDGYASDITGPQQYKDYHWPNTQEARTMWYHDHGVHRTASNVYMGLVAQYHLFDPAERALPLPKGTDFEGKSYDQPLTIQDAMFASDGSLIYNDRDESGLYGDVILVNGRPWPVMRVERRKYRFRILNASVSRGYRLALNTGQPFTVIGTDGGLMPHPQQVQSFRHGMGERYEVVIDFAENEIGQRVVLRNLSLKNNVGFSTTRSVMAFDVVSESTDSSNNAVPDVLNDNMNVMGLLEEDATSRAEHPVQARERTLDHQRQDLGRRRGQRVPADHRAAGAGRHRDLEPAQPLRGVVPPRPHPSRRLPDHQPQRPATGAARAGAQGRRVCRRGGAGARHHALRPAPRSLHAALPQPGARGPRHDASVLGARV